MNKSLLPRRSFLNSFTRAASRIFAVLIAFTLTAPYAALVASPRSMAVGRVLSLPRAAALAVTPPWDPFFANQTTIADFGSASAENRPFGIAAGDFNGDGSADLVVGRVSGRVAFVKGNGDGTFAPPVTFAWKQTTFNAWAFAAGDVNGDGHLDVIWGANAASSGCSVSPTPSTGCPSIVSVADGDVRVFYGNGNGTFQENVYFVSGVRHNAGTLLANIGADAGSVTAGDIDGDGDLDILAGGVSGTAPVVKILRNSGAFSVETLISQTCLSTTATTTCSPTYFPASSTQNSPWGLSLSDADGDGDKDLWVGDRALYVYLYRNNGAGAFTIQGANSAVSGRPNVYLGHDSFRAAVGFTPALGSGDINGDGKADLVLGLQSGTQTPASATPNDGYILLDTSSGSGHTGFGSLADIGTAARGVTVIDVNGDGALDIIAAEYDGKVKFLRQLPPVDSDGDGVSDYVDNSPNDSNRARIDMNGDGTVNHLDQLDNDFDTVLGDPENSSTWQRLGDPADLDDDNDGIDDAYDNCPFTSNADQADGDGDHIGDVCDPLNNRDSDGDGVPDGPAPGDPLYEAAKAAKAKWSRGTTHFVIRIDALGRFFQNEFTQIMTDAATLSPADWATKCWENYQPGDVTNGDGSTYEPCGTGEGTAAQTLTLGGGKELPVTLVTIPKQLWTDPPVISWINDRNDNPLFELGQHGTYHTNNIPSSDWKDMADRNFFSCEPCGLSEAENFELMRVGHDTLLGNYSNLWLAQSGATPSSPKIDWASSANPLLSYAPPFNTSDTVGRKAIAQLGFKAFSASVFEESGTYGPIFSPEGSHHERFDQFGMFHASADLELEPPDTTGDTYDRAAYDAYLRSSTNEGGLTTWLIEEVEWSGRPCQNDDRLGTCNGGSNRENNTVYGPRWEGWLQLLDYVKSYPGGVAMTMGEVALAKGFDNAPTVYNPDQADSDHDGIGDVIDGAAISAPDASLSRNQTGSLSARLANGGTGIAGQTLTFSLDTDGDGTAETFQGITNGSGTATVSVMVTRAVGPAPYEVSWNGGNGVTATGSGTVTVRDATLLTLDAGNPSTGQVTDSVTFGAKLTDSDGNTLAGQTVTFTVGSATGSGTTDGSGHVAVALTLGGPAGTPGVQAAFAGAGLYGASSDTKPFTVTKEDTTLSMGDAVASKNNAAVAVAVLKEADGAALAGRSIVFYSQEKVKGTLTYVQIGTATTGSDGRAIFEIPTKYVTKSKAPIRAVFAGDDSFNGSSADAFTYRQ